MASAGPSPIPRRLQVNFADLVDAFENSSWEVATYLDLDTGGVVSVTTEIRRELEAVYESLPSGSFGRALDPGAFASAVAKRQLPTWMREAITEADVVEQGLGTRFIEVPATDSREGHEDMEAFTETVSSQHLQGQLQDAIRGRGAFRQFKRVLAGHAQELDRWFAFRDARAQERVREWLASAGIDPVTEDTEDI